MLSQSSKQLTQARPRRMRANSILALLLAWLALDSPTLNAQTRERDYLSIVGLEPSPSMDGVYFFYGRRRTAVSVATLMRASDGLEAGLQGSEEGCLTPRREGPFWICDRRQEVTPSSEWWRSFRWANRVASQLGTRRVLCEEWYYESEGSRWVSRLSVLAETVAGCDGNFSVSVSRFTPPLSCRDADIQRLTLPRPGSRLATCSNRRYSHGRTLTAVEFEAPLRGGRALLWLSIDPHMALRNPIVSADPCGRTESPVVTFRPIGNGVAQASLRQCAPQVLISVNSETPASDPYWQEVLGIVP